MKAPKRNGRTKRLRPGDPAKWSKLDARLEAKLVAHIKEGLSYQTCCDLVSLSRATFYNWIARGESEPQSRYGAFATAIARAEAVAVRRLHIRVAASNPQWILERRHPALYGPPKQRLETELSAAGGAPVATNPFTVIVKCTATEQDHEYQVVDGETGLPVADQLNPYKNGHRASDARTGEQE
jgi:predicted DNA-binding transcriptional regulator AlpA